VLRPETNIWTSKYLNNLIEQEHRRVKQRIYPMLGFKNFRYAAVTISRIELAQKFKKEQFDIAKFTNGVDVRVPEMWEAVLVVRCQI
jgi:transposase-like protein